MRPLINLFRPHDMRLNVLCAAPNQPKARFARKGYKTGVLLVQACLSRLSRHQLSAFFFELSLRLLHYRAAPFFVGCAGQV